MAFGSMGGDDDTPMADINVTPLVDVMLVLLIVFMITMPVMTHSVPLALPTASDSRPEHQPEPKDPVRISVGKDGQYYLADGKPLSFKDLSAHLETVGKTDENTIIAIAADKDVAWEKVEDALSAVRDAGLNKVGFVTEVKDTE